MTLLKMLKSILGIGDSRSTDDKTETTVSIEHTSSDASGRGETAAESGSADAGPTSPEPDVEEPEVEEDEAEPEVEEEEPEEEEAEEEEPEEEEAEEEEAEEEEAEEAEVEEAAEEEAAAEDAGEPVDDIKGIGPTYADRLSEAGVETVGDLAGADAEELSGQADVPEGRLLDWIEKAKARIG